MNHKTNIHIGIDEATHEGSDALVCTVIEKLGDIIHRCGVIKGIDMTIRWEDGTTYLTPISKVDISETTEDETRMNQYYDPFGDQYLVHDEQDLLIWINAVFKSLFNINGKLFDFRLQDFHTFFIKVRIYVERLHIQLPGSYISSNDYMDLVNDLLKYLKSDKRINCDRKGTWILLNVEEKTINLQTQMNEQYVTGVKVGKLEETFGILNTFSWVEYKHWVDEMLDYCEFSEDDYREQYTIEMIRLTEEFSRRNGAEIPNDETIDQKIKRFNKIMEDLKIERIVRYKHGFFSIEHIQRKENQNE